MKVIDFKKASCRHCYKCVRSCPVKAIRVKNAQANILEEECILCGTCLEVCPQNAKTFISDLALVKKYIGSGSKTVVSLAPAYLGLFPYEKPGQIIDALLRLGFSEVRETAEGAAYVTKAYAGLLRKGSMKNIITTCCPSINDYVEKYHPKLTDSLAPVVSPMIAHGKLIKSLYGSDTKVVFIGPCISKKMEAEGDNRTLGFVDAVLTFDEISDWLAEENICIKDCDDISPANPDPEVNRLYPVSNGIVTSVLREEYSHNDVSSENPEKKEADSYRKIFVDGIEDCREVFEDIEAGRLTGCFIEANMCLGGCIKGPASIKCNVPKYMSKEIINSRTTRKAPNYPPALTALQMAKKFRPRSVTGQMPNEDEVASILHATGKFHKEAELNCGACGYSSCREKAIAVFQGKAEQEMCLPYIFSKAESMSNIVMDITPELIIMVDPTYKIIEFNKKAEEVFGISRDEALEKLIFELMDIEDFEYVYSTHSPVIRKKIKISDPEAVLVESIVYIEEHDSLLAIFHDITADEAEEARRMQRKMDTIEIAQSVIDKQMLAAQEIAGLLGETTAETKVILTQLRDSLLQDKDIEKTPQREVI